MPSEKILTGRFYSILRNVTTVQCHALVEISEIGDNAFFVQLHALQERPLKADIATVMVTYLNSHAVTGSIHNNIELRCSKSIQTESNVI